MAETLEGKCVYIWKSVWGILFLIKLKWCECGMNCFILRKQWMNYSEETVKMFIDIITPALTEEMNNYTNKECFQVIKENI